MGRPPSAGTPSFRFLPTEVAEMEKALEASNGTTPARHILEALTKMFSNAEERKDQLPIQYKQVWNWFQNRRHSQKVKLSKTAEKLNDPLAATDLSIPRKSSASAQGKKTNEVQELEFEAKSARDSAWYDVSMFLDHRISDVGEHEVRVRYTGFGPEEDEWVDIKTAVRQRSLPCEVLECVAVLPGDLILCFQEGSEQALYYDANILDVQRRRHDVRGCRCRFWVRYLHDQLEEVVPLRKVCRRPETEYRLKQQRSSKTSSAMETPQGSQLGRISPSPDTPIAEVHMLSRVENVTQLVPMEIPQVQSSISHDEDSIKPVVTHTLGAPLTASGDGTPKTSVAEGAANVSQGLAVHHPDSAPTAVDGTSNEGSLQSQVLTQNSQQQTLP